MIFMASKFIAMPVTQGDFFYLERESKIIVFDGGRYPQFTPILFQKYSSKNEIDYLVCSHNDADHASGVIGLLSGIISVKEVWLPGQWREIISEMHKNPDWEISIWEDAQSEDVTSLEDLVGKVSEMNRDDSDQTEQDSNESLENKIDEICEVDEYGDQYSFSWRRWRVIRRLGVRQGLFFDAIDAADRILQIAKLAYAHGAKIRWFDHQKFKENGHQPQGGENILRPLNSVEIGRFKRSSIGLLYKLALSVANRESLVFVSQAEGEPSVLFSADSNLENVQIPVVNNSDEFLVTSPHHGSEANKCVYGLFIKNQPTWARSDMKSKRRPCAEYKNQTKKFCTLCNRVSSHKTALIFSSNANTWSTSNSSCVCK